MSHFSDTWGHAGRVAKVLLVLIILYAVFSVYVLLWAFLIAPNLMEDGNTMRIVYAVVSFALATLIAVFHLSVMMFRRKKEHDRHDQTHTGPSA
jgi:membrane protein implicated in regulation of membrane protease activity